MQAGYAQGANMLHSWPMKALLCHPIVLCCGALQWAVHMVCVLWYPSVIIQRLMSPFCYLRLFDACYHFAEAHCWHYSVCNGLYP